MYINGYNITLGADPEVFVKARTQTREFFYCPQGLIMGTKSEPYRVEKGAFQVDGMAAEFNIDPVEDSDGFVDNIATVLGQLKSTLNEQGYDVYAVPVAHFSQKHYDEVADENKELGCNPDYNAYTGQVNPSPTPPTDEIFRTGAGHIHIGWGSGFNTSDPELLKACCHVIKHMDRHVGRPLAEVSRDYKRRSLYGAEGAFRPTSFGVEYRTPSNSWLNSKDAVKWVSDNTFKAVEAAFQVGWDAEVESAPEIYT